MSRLVNGDKSLGCVSGASTASDMRSLIATSSSLASPPLAAAVIDFRNGAPARQERDGYWGTPMKTLQSRSLAKNSTTSGRCVYFAIPQGYSILL